MEVKLSWTWFSTNKGIFDIYLSTTIDKTEYILWNLKNKCNDYAMATKVDAEISRLGIEMEGQTLKSLLQKYIKSRTAGDSIKTAMEKSSMMRSTMKAGWKKKCNDRRSLELLREVGLDIKGLL